MCSRGLVGKPNDVMRRNKYDKKNRRSCSARKEQPWAENKEAPATLRNLVNLVQGWDDRTEGELGKREGRRVRKKEGSIRK